MITVEKNGRGFFYGGGVDVFRKVEVDKIQLSLYPESIRGVSEADLQKKRIFLGCNWGCFAADIRNVNYFNPNFGPGSYTGAVGQESFMMNKLLTAGIKPFPIADCRTTHYAPENYHQLDWLYKRKFREGIQKGLLTRKKVIRTFISKSLKIFQRKKIKRVASFYFFMGMLKSLKFFFRKIDVLFF
jgi:hypothetical protein